MGRETFEFQGVTWFRHIPGSPMPCNSDDLVAVLLKNEQYPKPIAIRAEYWGWGDIGSPGVHTERDLIIGWCYGEKKA